MKKTLLFIVLMSVMAAYSPAFGRKKHKEQKYGREQFLQIVADIVAYPKSQVHDVTKADFKRYFKQNHPADLHYTHAAIALHVDNPERASNCLDSAFAAYTPKAYINEQLMHDLKLRIVGKTDPKKMLPEIEKYLATYPAANQLLAYQLRAKAYESLQKWELAIADYRKVVELCDTACAARVYLAKIMIDQNQNDSALEVLNECQERFPEYAETYRVRAKLREKMGLWREAIEDMLDFALTNQQINYKEFQTIINSHEVYAASAALKKSKEYSSENAYLSSIASSMYTKAYLYQDAAALAEQAFDENSYFSRSVCYAYYALGLYDDVIKFAKFFEEQYNERDVAMSTLGAIGGAYNALGKHQKAIEYFTKAYQEDPSNFVYHQLRASSYLYMNDTLNALKYFDAALSMNPTDTISLFFRGAVYKKMGLAEKSQADFQKFLAASPVDGNYMLVECYNGNTTRAVEICDSLIQADPYDYHGYYGAACLYSNLNQKAKALTYLRKSFDMGQRDFNHVQWDYDLDNIKQMPEFKAMIEEYKAKPLYTPNAELPHYYDEETDGDHENDQPEPINVEI